MESVGVMKHSPEKMVLSIATIWCFPIFLPNLEKIEQFYSPTETTNKKKIFFSHQEMNSYLGASIIEALGKYQYFW